MENKLKLRYNERHSLEAFLINRWVTVTAATVNQLLEKFSGIVWIK